MKTHAYRVIGRLLIAPPLLMPALPLSAAEGVSGNGSGDRVEEINVTGVPWDYRSDTAETAMKRAVDIMKTPASIQVVPSAVIQDQQALSLEQVLGNVSSTVFVDGGEGVQVFSRGFSASTFKNGFPLTEFIDGDIQRSHLDTYNIERVEVYKGPASVLYGRGNPGGTINIITKKPLETSAFRAGLVAGSEDLQRRAHIDATGPVNPGGSLRYRLTAFYEDSDSYRDFVEREEYAIAPTLALGLSADTMISLFTEFAKLEAVPDGGLPGLDGSLLPGISRDLFLGEPLDRREDERQTAQLSMDHQLENGWELQTMVMAENTEGYTAFARPNGILDDGRTVRRGFVNSETAREDYRVQSQLNATFSTAALEHDLLIGLEAGKRDTEVLFAGAPIANIDLLAPVYGARPGDPSFTFVSSGERALRGIFIQDMISFDERWNLVLGARYDYVEQDIVSGLLGNTREQPVKRDEALSPNAGLVYQPSPQLSWYLSWSESFQAQNGVPVSVAGEVLDPEIATQYETGFKFSLLNDRLGGNLALYNIDKEGARSPDRDNRGFQTALGEVNSRGIELDLAGSLMPGWRVMGAYAYNDSEIQQDTRMNLLGKRPKEMPEHSANLWTTYEISQGSLAGLGFGAGVSYVGERFGDDANTFDLPSYSRVDASVFYRHERFTARLNLYNLLDEEIVSNMARGSFIRLARPLTARASIEYNF